MQVRRNYFPLKGRLPSASQGAHVYPCACERSSASGRPWSTLRAWRGGRELTLGQTKGKPSRHGGQDAGNGEGWDKRAHHGAARATRRYARGLGGGVGAGPPLKRT